MKKDYVKPQTKHEHNKILLLRMEMYKERMRIRKENPEVTDKDLNELFPYPN